MDVEFGSRGLERCYQREGEAARAWGPQVGRRYIQRVNLLYVVERFQDLFAFQSLRLHPLKGEREGEWALALHGRWRLILVKDDERKVTIKEVISHYGD